MRPTNLGTIKRLKFEQRQFTIEILMRCLLFVSFLVLENLPAFHREILTQEQWLYSYPSVRSYVPARILYPLFIGLPLSAIWWYYHKDENEIDVVEAFLCVTLSFAITVFTVAILKNVIGRPRPNFISRCFPDGNLPQDLKCDTGTYYDLTGRKSFPSGHAAMAFASMTFVSLYLAGKMKLFIREPDGQGLKLFVFFVPFLFATLLSVSRICDYHHHWEDVLAGAIIGMTTTWICYHLYYPNMTTSQCNQSHKMATLLVADFRPKLKDIPKRF